MLQLVEQADVIVESFAPGVMERLDFGETVLREANPRLIYTTGSGYSETGPHRNFSAINLTVQAMTGVIDTTGYSDMPLVKAGPTIADYLAGTHLFGAVATALFARERTGKGCSVDVPMMESVYTILASSLALLYGSDNDAEIQTGNRHAGMSLSPYNFYPILDGYIEFITNDDQHWLHLTEALGCPELAADPRLCSMEDRCAHRDEVDGLVAEQTSCYTKQELSDLLFGNYIPWAPVRTLAEVVNDPNLHARVSLQWIDHAEYGRMVEPSSPLRFS